MAWTEQIRQAAYTSPDGRRMVFNFESQLRRETPLKTAEHTFPDVDGAEVQPLGLGGKKFPMTAIFSGPDCMRDADDFEKLLSVRGYGTLEHPVYGKHTVVPTGEISRADNVLSGLNEATVDVTFSESITDKPLPESKVSAVDALDEAAAEYENAAEASFIGMIETGSVEDEMQLQSVLKAQADSFFKNVSAIAEKINDFKEKSAVLQKINNLKKNVNEWTSKIDKLKENAQNIASVLTQAARLTAQTAMAASEKISGYATAITDIINSVKKDIAGAAGIKNQYASTSLMVGVLVDSMSLGVAKTAVAAGTSNASSGISDGGFESRASVLEAADLIAKEFDVYKCYMDSQVGKNAFVDTGEGYEALLDMVVCAIQVMQTVAFELPVTRIIRLGRDRQIMELLCELYGQEGFTRLDQFIVDNRLTADEIVCIPMGREVRYYA